MVISISAAARYLGLSEETVCSFLDLVASLQREELRCNNTVSSGHVEALLEEYETRL